MPLPLIPILLLGGAGLGAFLLTRKSGVDPVAAKALRDQFATRGPKGEYAFKTDIAATLARGLTSQLFAYPEPTNQGYIKIAPDPNGAPVPPDSSAAGWAARMNATQSILAPLYMATPNNSERFLRAVTSGQEAELAGENGMYAVLLYAGTYARQLPPPGLPGQPPAPPPPEPQHTATNTLPDDLQAEYQALLTASNPDPDELDRVANELDQYGMSDAAKLLRTRASDLRKIQALQASQQAPQPLNIPSPSARPAAPRPGSPPAPRPAAPAPAPAFPALSGPQDNKWVQNALNQLGYGPLTVDGVIGPLSKAAVIRFQQAKGLSADGVPGPITKGALAAALAGGQAVAPSSQSVPPPAAYQDNRWVQSTLNALGFGPLTVDGAIGPLSKSAVIRFQQSKGLAADGIPGPITKAALQAALSANVAVPASPPPPGEAPPEGAPMIALNLLTVLGVQQALNYLGANPRLDEDGASGPHTSATIKAFQSSHGLSADGIVGPMTRDALRSALQALAGMSFNITGKMKHKMKHPHHPKRSR